MSQSSSKLEQAVGGVRCAAVSDVGMRRSNNQDAMAVSLADGERQFRSGGHLFMVADGMGAHAAGELASQIAADNIPLSFRKHRELAPCEAIVAAVQDANSRIYAKGQNSVDFQGMGTTCSCLVLLEEGALAAHVGDSRVYRLRSGVLEQLTFDHSLVWEMAAAGQASEEQVPAYVPKNVITRSLGPHPSVKVDLEGPFPLAAGDRYLLCSDGLTGPLTPQLIGMVLDALPPKEAAQTLVDLANLLGGPDNITVVAIEVTAPDQLGETQTCELPASDGARRREKLSPATWACLLGSGAALVVTIALAAGQYTVPAAVAGATTLGLGLLGAIRWVSERQGFAGQSVRGRYGKGPHRKYQVAATAETIGTLGEIVRQLEDLESQREWHFDWQGIHQERQRAYEAIASGDFRTAVVAYCSAVRMLMQAVRDFRRDPPGDSSINLGED
ncbi:MAG: serine/threonine-protein phosphatase [Planctomycetales bacterium]|nr:serine/threonine-protein phosphatase [Planctomycetales bacterium]